MYWQEWNNNSLADANDKYQLIIISIGYSACHWCHVRIMKILGNNRAQIMNAHFVNIKWTEKNLKKTLEHPVKILNKIKKKYYFCTVNKTFSF